VPRNVAEPTINNSGKRLETGWMVSR
jgi:hypothetical protein